MEISGRSEEYNRRCRVWVNKLDRKDGTFIIRYKVYETCYNLSINIFYKSKQIKGYPLKFEGWYLNVFLVFFLAMLKVDVSYSWSLPGPIHPDDCNCPEEQFDEWLLKYGCKKKAYKQIEHDLKPFRQVNMQDTVKKIIDKFHRPESTSFCHYVIKNNDVYRNCYGKHVGFNMFADNILLFLTRKVYLPDMELVINLGDWPLVRKNNDPWPVFSWCGNDDTIDIVMPTYDITESTLENMGR